MMGKGKSRPGLILYLDALRPVLNRLPNEQIGLLIRGIVEYVETGAIPELDDMTGLAFDLLRPSIDRDGERYEQQKMHGQYMAYCRAAKERGDQPISEEEYKQQLIDTNSCYQLPTPSPAPEASPTSNATATAAGEAYPAVTATRDMTPEEEERRRQELQRQLLDYRPNG